LARRGTSPLASLIITLGLGIGSYAVLILIWGDQPHLVRRTEGQTSRSGGVGMQVQYVLVVLLTAAAFVALGLFFSTIPTSDVG